MNREKVVEEARAWLGTPYLHQASLKGAGCDCLGLIRGIWRRLYGQEPQQMPAYSWDWSEARREEVLWSAAAVHLDDVSKYAPLRQGDVLLFRMREASVAKHLGVISETKPAPRFIHAYCGHGVVENTLSLPWQRRIVARFTFQTKQ